MARSIAWHVLRFTPRLREGAVHRYVIVTVYYAYT